LFCISSYVHAETYLLDLDESIAIAKMKSYDMLSLKEDLKIAEYNLQSTVNGYKTHVDLDLVTPNYTETISQYEDTTGISYYSVRQSIYSSSLVISQPLPTDGDLYISSGLKSTDDYNDSDRWLYMNTRIGITQPLEAFYAYNYIKAAYKTAKLAYEKSQKQLRREELNLEYNVSNLFYSLLSVQKKADIARSNLERQKEAFEIAKNKFDAGLIREVDALQMEVDLAEAQNNYDLSLVNQSAALNSFKELIGVELKDSVVISSSMDYKMVEVDVQKAVDLALQNRLEIREQEIQIELNELSIKKQKSKGMVSGEFSAYFQKIGIDNSNLSDNIGGSVNDSYNDLLDRPGNYGVGLTISIPIIDWGENKALVRAAEATLQKNVYERESVIRGIETEVRNLVANFNSSMKRLQLLEKNVIVAEKSFEITRARFTDGDVDSQALALERERLNNAYSSHLNAYINYELNLANLMRKTFYDFKNNRPI
jgi:outer membrane protein TolC